MAEPYLSNLRQLTQSLSISGEDKDLINCKHFFSGAAGYIDEKIFISLSPAGLALKLPQANCDALLGKGASPLRYFPKAPVKKGYVVLPPDIVDDENSLAKWVTTSISFARADRTQKL